MRKKNKKAEVPKKTATTEVAPETAELNSSPKSEKNIVKKEISQKEFKRSRLLVLLNEAKKEIPDTNPFKVKLQGLIDEIISKI